MAFIQFHPCERCGSRNNLAEYSDGFYCFGCGHRERKNSLEHRFNLKPTTTLNLTSLYDGITLDRKLPKHAKKWLLGYGLHDDEIDKFSYDYNKHILMLVSLPNYWQGRCFAPDSKTKYLSKGEKPFIQYGHSFTAVLVEDVISAIKVGRSYAAIPMLGSMALKRMETPLKRFHNVILWGDYDKAKENVIQARKLQERLGIPVIVKITEYDPKEYTDQEIRELIGA